MPHRDVRLGPGRPARSSATARCGAAVSSTPSSSWTPTTTTRARRGWPNTGSRSPPSAASGTTPRFTAWADVDGRAGTDAAVEHLVSSGYGRHRLPRLARRVPRRRRATTRAGSRARHATTAADATLQATTSRSSTTAIDAAGPLIDRVGRGGAVVCASDLLALGGPRGAAQPWPRARLVTSGSSASTAPQPALAHGLTSVAQPYRAIADELLTQVHDQLTTGRAPTPPAPCSPPPSSPARSSYHSPDHTTAPATHHQEKS